MTQAFWDWLYDFEYKQISLGLSIIVLSIIASFIFTDGSMDITPMIFMVPFGLWVIFTKERFI